MSSCFPLTCVNTGLDARRWEKMRFITKTFVRMQILVSVSFCLLLVKRKLLKAQNLLLRWDQANKPTPTYVRSAQMFNFSTLFCLSLWSPYRNTHTHTHEPHTSNHLHKSNKHISSSQHLSRNLQQISSCLCCLCVSISESVVAKSHVRACFVSHPRSGLSVCTFHNFFNVQNQNYSLIVSHRDFFSAIQGRLGQTVPLLLSFRQSKTWGFFWFEGELGHKGNKRKLDFKLSIDFNCLFK